MHLIDGQPVYSATDLVGFLACAHRFELERAALARLVKKPIRSDPAIELIAKRGYQHEQRYLDELVATGLRVVKIEEDGSATDDGERLRAAVAQTEAAIRTGVDVVYQATFFDGRWRGHADFLLRVERPSRLGAWSYEVADTKLARKTKGSAILQVCSYVDQLTRAQGLEPDRLHIVLGGSARLKESFRVADFMAYYRRVKADFEAAVEASPAQFPPAGTYPDPVEHCEICRWSMDCRARRRTDDDLSLVAGITARQRRGLKETGIPTRRGLAVLDLPLPARVAWSGAGALERVREQARIQVEAEDEGSPRWEYLLPLPRDEAANLVPDRGFLVLPEPSPNDLFFDIEGDPFALDDGVEYLFGVLEPGRPDHADQSKPRFHEIWSRDEAGEVTRAAEKRAFEALVDLLIDRLNADPTLHVYHYAAYEKSALGRLAQRHATREEEVDRLLRGGVLIDLFRVVHQGIRAGVESYSIKRLEPLYGLTREVDLRSAGSSIVAFEAWLEGGETEDGQVGEGILREIVGYNRDDVLSNWRLRDWLEERRRQLQAEQGVILPRPPLEPEAKAPRPLGERAARAAALVERLAAGIPDKPTGRTPEQQATWLLAQLLNWHRREDRAYWWRFYELCRMTDDDLVGEREPLGRIELVADLGESGRNGRLQQFRFPPQDHGCKPGRSVIDPLTEKSTGAVRAIDEIAGTITLHRTRAEVDRSTPTSLIPDEYVGSEPQEEALLRIASWVADHGIAAEGAHQAARDLLRRLPPRAGQPAGAPLRHPEESVLGAGRRLALSLDRSTLPIQGPPGTGKTYTGARMILDLVRNGRKVGITANSHKVIGNMLDAVHEAARDERRSIRLGQKPGLEGEPTCEHARTLKTDGAVASALAADEVDVVGGTTWLWAEAKMAGSVHVLVVDEAGQMSLANAVAASAAAESLVLIGDPQQLDQPTKGSHPPGAERSALGDLLGEQATIAPEDGLFLDLSWRLHPDLCAFTSEVFYRGELQSEPTMARQTLLDHDREGAALPSTGICWMPVEHADNITDSPQEAARIQSLIEALLGRGTRWIDHQGGVAAIGLDEILIVAPYNAHVELIGAALPTGARVGTVDKFQGQEAPISIYAMGTSSPELAPRGMEFLYSLNRLNVATSRARCLAIVMASPALLQVQCHTPRQMRLANALARFVEMSAPAG